jgi:hypothetical protein
MIVKICLFCSLIICVLILTCKSTTKRTTTKSESIKQDLIIYPNALYPISIKGKWGFMNNKFDIVITPQYHRADDFYEGMAVVTVPGVDNNNQTNLYGYVDTTGKIIISCQYDNAYPFSEGLAVVVKNAKYGFIDKTGKEVIPLIYEEASKFSEGLAVVKLNGKNGFIDSSGRIVISPQFERACWVSDFSEGLAAVYTSPGNVGGYIDKAGKMILPATYNYAGAFSEGLALVQPEGQIKYGYINKQGKIIIEPQFEMGVRFSEGTAAVKYHGKNGKSMFRLINKRGITIADNLGYAFIGIFSDGLAGVESFSHQWGFIDKSGNEVIKPQFAGAKLFRNGLSRMETGDLFSGLRTVYINKNGNIVWQE